MNTVKNIICMEGKKAQGVNNRLLPPVTSCCFFASFSVQQFIMYSVVKKNSKENLVIGSFKKKNLGEKHNVNRLQSLIEH